MADRLTLQDNGESSLSLLIVDALAFWARNQAVFWLVALPIAGLGAAIAFVLDRHQQFAGLRNHWGWDFLFAPSTRCSSTAG